MDWRVARGVFDDQSCTDRPWSGAAVGLATIPDTVTLPSGCAIVGVIDVMAIHGCARATVWLASAAAAGPVTASGAAAAGPVISHPAPAAAARAASRRLRLRPRCCR